MTVLTVERHLHLARTPADCYRYLRDFSTCEQWDPGVDRAIKRSPGLPGVGSEFDLMLRVVGRRVPMRYRLVEADEASRLLLHGVGDGFEVRDEIRLSAAPGEATLLHYRADMDLQSVPGALAGLAQRWCERIGSVAMAGLKTALEDDSAYTDRATPTLAERLVLPAARDFTARGYHRQRCRGLTRPIDGQLVAITGATGGIGLATAQLLARLGARLILIGRGADKLHAAAEAVRDFAGPCEIRLLEAELSLVADCRRAAQQLLAEGRGIDVLINNAGALPLQRTQTSEGHELALAVNLLAPYTLTRSLSPLLSAVRGRVVNMVSGGLYLQGLRLDDLAFSQRPYEGAQAYAQAKRGLLAMTRHWHEDPALSGLRVHAVHPGWAATPGVATSLPGFNRLLGSRLRDARMGADTQVWLASHPQFGERRHTGKFWFDRQPRPTAVVPGTDVSDADRAALARWLEQVCGV